MKKIIYTVGDAGVTGGRGQQNHRSRLPAVLGLGADVRVLAISKLSPAPERGFREWYRGRERKCFALGAVQFVAVSPDVSVANMIGQPRNPRITRRAADSPALRLKQP